MLFLQIEHADHHNLTEEQVVTAKSFFDCQLKVLRNAKEKTLNGLFLEGKLSFLRHFRVFYEYVLL